MEKPQMCYWVKNKLWKNYKYKCIPFTVKKMKLFLPIYKHKCMSIL